MTEAHIEVLKEEENLYYWINLKCSNCNKSGSFAILKGQKAMFAKCPKCGCDTLEQPDRND